MAIGTQQIFQYDELDSSLEPQNVLRSQTANQEKDGQNGLGNDTQPDDTDDNPGLPQFDDYGLRANYTDDGYLDLNGGAGDKASFTFDAPAGTYLVTLRVAASSNREIALRTADGATTDPQNTLTDANWSWETRTFEIAVSGDGPHTVVIEQTTGAGPNIDALIVHDTGTTASFYPPEITSDATFTAQEDGTAVGTVTAQDLDGDDVAFALVGTDDDALFDIDPTTGELTFLEAPDFDADGAQTSFTATVEATANGQSVQQTVTVTLENDPTDDASNPVIDQIVLQAEDGTIAADGESFARTQAAARADAEAGEPFTIAEGSPNGDEKGAGQPLDEHGLRVGYGGTGYLDFEQGTDEAISWTVNVDEAGPYDLHVRYANGDEERSLDIVVGGQVQHAAQSFAGNGFENWLVKTFTVTLGEGDNVIDLAIAGNTNGPNIDAVALTSVGAQPSFPVANTAPAFDAAPASVDVQEGETAVTTFALADDGQDDVTFALSGPDAGLFNISAAGELTFVAAPDFEAPAGEDNAYAVTVTVTDEAGSATHDLVVNVTDDPSDDAGPNQAPTVGDDVATTDEDTAVVIDVADLVADDTDGDDALTITAESASGSVDVDGTVLTFTPDADFAGEATITYRAQDSEGATSEDASITVTVNAVDDAATGVTLVAVDPAPAENVAGAVLADIVVADVDTTYDVDDVTLSDTTNFRVVGTPGALQLALAENVSLDAEAASQPSVTVTAGGATSAAFTPQPSDVDEGGPVEVLFDTGALTSYSSQDKPGTGTPTADGGSVTLAGNLWKRAPLAEAYDITGDTRLTVDLTVGAEKPEIVGIGVDGDDSPFDGDGLLFQLAGTQNTGAFVDLRGQGEDLGGGVLRFTLDLSPLAGSSASSLVLVNDDDNGPFGSSTFAGVTLFEADGTGGNAAPRVVGGGVTDLTVDENADLEVDLPFVDDDGDALTFGFTIADADGVALDPAAHGLSLDGGTLVGAAPAEAGVYTVTLTAVDPDGSATQAETAFTLTVEDVNEAPVSSDPALEPFFVTAGQPIEGIDLASFAGFFTDPNGDELTLSAEDLPAGLSVNDEGVIVGTPTVGGDVTVTIRATDPLGLSDTLTIDLSIQGGGIGDVVVVEAEDFTGVDQATGFFVTGQAGASGDQILRSTNGTASSVSTDLSTHGIVEGWYEVAMTRYDETDGSATYSLSVGDAVLAEDALFDEGGTFDNTSPRGGAGQPGNLKTIVFETPVYVTAGTVMTLSGTANAELLRTDKFAFTRVEEPNQAPSATTIDAATVAENDAGAIVGTLSATDPEGQAITFTVADTRFEVANGALKLVDGAFLDFEAGATVDVVVTATDALGASTETTLTLTVTDEAEAPLAPTLAGTDVTENVEGASAGTLSATSPDGKAVTFTTTDPRFEVVGDELKLKDGVSLDFEAGATTTVSVTADDGEAQTTGDVAVTVLDANDAPTLADGVSLNDVQVAFGAGTSVDLTPLGASDQDADDVVAYAVAGANGTTLPEGFAVVGTDLVVPSDAPAGTYEVEVFAQDGLAQSESVSFTVTVGDPAPFQSFAVQGQDAAITLSANPDGDSTETFHRDENVASEAEEPGGDKILENGIRAGYSGTGYIDFGDDPGDAATFTVNVPTAGQYDLNVRYASQDSGGSPRVLDLSINGGAPVTTTFPTTGNPDGSEPEDQGFNSWEFLTQTITLNGGTNTITLALAPNTSAGPNVDRIEITVAGSGPIPAEDDTADADGNLDLSGPTGELTETQAASINFQVTGRDEDIVKVEISFDGGVTRTDVTDDLSAEGNFVFDGSGLAAGPQTATIVVTDAVGNEATDTLDFSVGEASADFTPVTIQAEDATITDLGGPGSGPAGRAETRVVNEQNPDAFSNFRAGAVGDEYVDFGEDVGDAVAFTLTVPADGTYTATIRYANGGSDTRPLALSVDGGTPTNVAFASTGSGDAGWENWTDITVELQLKQGENTVSLAIPAPASGGTGSGPNIDQITFAAKEDDGGGEPGTAQTFEEVVRINFEAPTSGNGAGLNAPSGYTTPAGFEADTGEAYGSRGNGFTYGWVDVDDANGTVTSTPAAQPTGSMRYKDNVSEASDLQKTYAHFDYPGTPDGDRERAWEIELENGVYELTVAVGDTAGQYDSDYVLNVEGQPFGPSWEPVNNEGQKLVGGAYDPSFDGEGFRSLLHTGIVTVADGRLTIDGLSGENVEIQWLDIERVPDLTPGDDRSADLDYSKFVDAVAATTNDGQVSIEIGANGQVPLDIDPTSSFVVGVQLQAIDHRGPAVADTGGVKLVETLTGVEVPINVQVTGGADSLTIRPLQDLKENTSYTLKVEDVLDLGNLNDSSLPKRQMQDYATTFVTGEKPVVTAREVAFDDVVQIDGFADGGAAFTSIEFGPDGKLYVATIMGELKRWDVNADGTVDKSSVETLSLDYFQDTGRSIIGIAFDPEDPNTIWVSDNAPVPREGKADKTPEFSGQVSKITLGDGGSFAGAEAEAYITGLPRSGGDHVTNSLEFRNVGTAESPEYLLYVMQGSNSAAGRADDAWGFRPERLLNAAALEIDHTRDAPDGGFDVQTEPYDPATNAPTFRDDSAVFGDMGTVDGFYDPFAEGAVLKIFGEGIRNAYDLVWHSNGFLYAPTNGTARGGNTLDDPTTDINEQLSGLDKQNDFLFRVVEGGYYGHPNDLLGHYVVNGGATGPNSANTSDGGNEYPDGVEPDEDYDAEGSYSLGFNKSPNGAIEYRGDKFGANLQGALLFAQFSVGDNVRVINVDPATGVVTGDDVLRRPGGEVIDEYIDPLDIIENPTTGQLYLMTLNRGSGESKIVLLNPAPGGVSGDNTADEGGDLALVVVDDTDASAVQFRVDGLDADIQTITVSFDGGAPEAVTLGDGNLFTRDLSSATGQVTATLVVQDGSGNTADASAAVAPGGASGDATVIDATQFTVLSTLTGDAETVIRRIDDPSTHEPSGGNDGNNDGLNDGYDGLGYLDPNGGAEDKASFEYVAPGEGTYQLVFRMASNSDRAILVKTGTQSEAIAVNTGGFTTWIDFPVTLELEAGSNTIVIEQTTGAGPNVDSVTITPLSISTDTTADEGDDLALNVVDVTDLSAATFEIEGLDADIQSVTVAFGDDQPVTLQAQNGQFEIDLSGKQGIVSAVLAVEDGSGNSTSITVDVALSEVVPNDGEETVDGVGYVVYEAENGTFTGDPAVIDAATSDRGQRGGEFVDFLDSDETITWTVEVPEDGTYAVDIVYALGPGKGPRPLTLSVDGAVVETLQFPSNSNQAESQWGPESTTLTLTAGVHEITVLAPGGVGPNVDYLRISSSPLSGDITADEGGDLELVVVDQSDPSAVVFQVNGLDADITGLEVSFNGGAAQVVALDDDDQFTADVGLAFGQVDAVLTVTDGTNLADAEAEFSVAPGGDPDADIEVASLDPAFFEDRLHFSFVNTSDGRESKETAQFEITNTGSEPLEILDFTISEFYSVVEPSGLAGTSIAAGDSLLVTVEFDGSTGGPDGFPSRSSNVSGVYEGTLSLVTNDAEDPFTELDLAAFWQPAQEKGNEPNVNEVWQVLGFGNEIDGLPFAGGGENSILDFDDLYLPAPGQEGIEVLSPYWRIADGVTEATATIIAAYNASSSAGLGIHAPGNKGQDKGLATWSPSDQSQTLFPLKGNGDFATLTFGNGFIPDAWTGDDVFGIEMAGLSTDPTLNQSGNGTPSQSALDAAYGAGTYFVSGTGANAVVTDAEGNVVEDGYTVRMFQALDAAGNAIPNVYLGMMDYTGINYDYNDNMFLFEGITPVGAGGALGISGLDDAAADDRLVFTNIENPNNNSKLGAGVPQNFRKEATFTIENDGIGDLEVTALTFGGDDAGSFVIVGDAPTTIAAGDTADVTVEFVGTDGVDDNAAVLHEATLTVETDAGNSQISLAGLAQLQSESGEEPTVAQVVEAFGYGTDVAQGQLNGGGDVETIGDEVLMPYLERLDGSQPVEVINLAAFLQQGDISRLHIHELSDDGLTQLFAGDDQQGQTVLPDGLVAGLGDTGAVGRASIDRDEPFGLKVTVDGRPTFAAWTDPEANIADPELGVNDEGHYIRFFQAKDGQGQVIEGTFIGVQDYPGGGNFDYNDAMFLVRNVKPHTLTAENDGDSDGVNDALQTDADNDGLVAFFDADDAPTGGGDDQAPFGGTAPVLSGSLTVEADTFDTGGQGVAWNDDPGKNGGDSTRGDSDVEIIAGDIAFVEAGEWVEYTVNVAQPGTYDFSVVAKAPTDGATVTLSVENGPALATITLPDSNGGSDDFGGTSFGATPAVPVTLAGGVQTLRVTFGGETASNGYVLDFRSFTLEEVAATNGTPTTTGISGAPEGQEGSAYDFDVAGFFDDPDADDTLTFTAEGLPSGLSISSTGVITGTPTADGTFSVTVTASDGQASVEAPFTLTVDELDQPTGQAPFGGTAAGFADGVLTLDAAEYDEGGQGVAYNDAAGLQGGDNGGRAGSDVEITGQGDIGWIADGEWYEYTIVVGQAGLHDLDLQLAFGSGGARSATVEFYAAGASTPYASTGPIANPNTGGWTSFLSRTAEGIDLQSGEQVVRVTFNGGSQDFRSLTLTRQEVDENQAPVASAIADAGVDEGAAISIDVSGSFFDPDGDDLTYTVEGLDGLTISSAGVVTGTAPQVASDTQYAITVTASDGGLSDSASFTLTVEDQPVVGPTQTPFPGPDAPVLGQSLVVDATDYDAGGQGVSWNDDPGRDGGNAFRSGTDVELVGAQNDIGFVEQGEWVEYTVDVAEAGTYDLSVVAKTPIGGNTVTVSLGDGPTLATVALPDSNGSSTGFGGTTFAPTDPVMVQLEAGLQTLRFTFDGTPAGNGYLLDMRSFSLDRVEDAGGPGGSGGGEVIGEAGTVTVTQGSSSEWFTVTFAESLENPSVVMGPISLNGVQEATMRVRNVTSEGFEYQLDEWNYLDGGHITETVSWVALESGVHEIGGQTVLAGVGSSSEGGSSIAFGQSFDTAPVVMAQVTSTDDPDAVTDRIDGVTAAGFSVALDDEEANDSAHGTEDLAWIAVEKGGSASGGLYAAATGNNVTHNPSTVSFGSAFEDEFAFLADMQTEDGGDPATVRLSSLSSTQAQLFVEEEQSADTETNHTTEDVGVFGISAGLITSDDVLT